MLKFCPNISTMFQEYGFLERFSKAKNMGFKHFEVQSPYEYLPEDIQRESHSMQCVLMNTYVDTNDEGFGYAAVPGEDMKFAESLSKINSYYFALGVQKIHILSGLKVPGVTSESQLEYFVNSLKSTLDFLDTFDMVGLLEPICEEVKPNYFMSSFDLAVEAINRVNSGNIKLLLDVYHLHKITGNVMENLPKYYPYAGHIQISQDPGRREPFYPGGKIDYDFVFKFLKEKNHQDPIGLEYFPSESTEKSLEWIKKFQ